MDERFSDKELNEAIYDVSRAAQLSGISEGIVHNLINTYKYIVPPMTGEYNGQPKYMLSEDEVRYLKIFAQLKLLGYKPREICHVKRVYEFQMQAADEIQDVFTGINLAPEVLIATKERIAGIVLCASLLDERELEALRFFTN